MRVIAVTGSASGIGAATRLRLERSGDRVLGIDLRDAEIIADLSLPAGRREAVLAVQAASRGTLDGLVVCAGLGPQFEPHEAIVSLNYFGAAELLRDLRPLLAAGHRTAAVAIASNSATATPGADGPLAQACLDGDESAARAIAGESSGPLAYAASKLALARLVRRSAASPEWAGCGIRLNAVAPGPVQTPLLEGGLAHPQLGAAIRGFPVPLGGFGSADSIAAVTQFLLSPDASFCCGSVVFADGGTDAMLRPAAF